MFWLPLLTLFGLLSTGKCSDKRSIIQNGQVKPTSYPNTAIDASTYSFHTYPANASELSYKGRWDSKKVSWWA
jgi:hypothetical protein